MQARTDAPLLSADEVDLLGRMVDNVARALMDRQLQQSVFVVLQRIIPDVERIQQMRGAVPYSTADSEEVSADALLNPSPIHSPEFEAWVKDALRHYWGGPKLLEKPARGAAHRRRGRLTRAARVRPRRCARCWNPRFRG